MWARNIVQIYRPRRLCQKHNWWSMAPSELAPPRFFPGLFDSVLFLVFVKRCATPESSMLSMYLGDQSRGFRSTGGIYVMRTSSGSASG